MNAQYRAAEAQFDAVRERIPESVAGLLPSVTATSNTFWNENTVNTLGQQQYNSNGWTVMLTQPVLRPQNVVAVSQAHAQVDQASAQLSLARQDLLIRTAQAYFDVLFARDVLNSYKEERAADLQQMNRAERRFEVGSAPITDVRDTEARYAMVTAQELRARNDVVARMQVLREIINRRPGPLAELRADAVLTRPIPDTSQPWESAARNNNAAVTAARAALAVARLEVRKARAGELPTVDLVAMRGYTRSPLTIQVGQLTYATSVGIQVSIPVFAGGGSWAKIRENVDLLEKAQDDLDDAQRASVLAAQQAYLGATSGLALVKALQRAVLAGKTAVESNERGIQVGDRIRVDVLNAKKDLAATERDLARARYETIMWLLKLKSAVGSLSDADVEEVNALLTSHGEGAGSD